MQIEVNEFLSTRWSAGGMERAAERLGALLRGVDERTAAPLGAH
ncbi:MAG: hypothetical protein ABIQ16_15550 [Polyangiaceae bacterium]